MNSYKQYIKRYSVAIVDGSIFRDVYFARLLFLIYTSSYIFIFLIPADFWDDLAFRNAANHVTYGYQSGRPLLGYFWAGIYALPGHAHFAHLFVFCAFITGSFCIRKTLRYLNLLEEKDRNAAVLLISVFPLFQSRFLEASGYYTLNYLLFCVSTQLIAKYIADRRFYNSFFGCGIAILAFFTDSFVVMFGYFTFILWIYFLSIERHEKPLFIRCTSSAINLLKSSPEIFLIPFLYFFFIKKLFPLEGAFIGYNSLRTDMIFSALLNLPLRAIESLFVFTEDFSIYIFAILIAFYTLSIFFINFSSDNVITTSKISKPSYSLLSILVAFIGVMFAIFPYNAVGKYANPYDFADINQLTLIFVAGPLVMFILSYAARDWLKWPAVCLLITLCVAQNISSYLYVLRDGHTQNALVLAFRQSAEIKGNNAFLIDMSRYPNLSRRRVFGTAQLNCLMKDAFHDETRFAAALSRIPFNWQSELSLLTIFKDTGTCFRGYIGGHPLLAIVYPGNKRLSLLDAPLLSIKNIFSEESYKKDIDGVISILMHKNANSYLE